jgi:signal peptidase I
MPFVYVAPMVPVVGVLPFVAFIARNRVRRAWGWWAISAFAMLGFALSVWAGVVALVVEGLVIADAIRVALQRPADGTPPAPKRRWLHLGAMLVAAIGLSIWMRAFVVEAYRIPSSGMAPTLLAGDHVFAGKLGVRFGGPALGDIAVLRNPCRPEVDYVKRVVALAGDRVEIRCDQLYRNGVAVPSEPVGGPCAYDDIDDRSGAWAARDCQRRRETLGDVTHDVLLDPDATGTEASQHDFPEPGARDAGFSCHVDRRGPAERARSAGQVVSRADVPADDACAQRAHFVVPPGHVFVMGDNRHNSADSRAWGPVPVDHVKGRVDRIWWSLGPAGMRWDRVGAVE